MNDFSSTQEVDDPCVPCQQGNWFLADFSSPQKLQFSVNGQSTGKLPNNTPYKLPNTLSGTTSRLAFSGQGRNITLAENLSTFSRTKPEESGVLVGDFRSGSDDQAGLMSSAGPASTNAGEDVLNLVVPPAQRSFVPVKGFSKLRQLMKLRPNA